MRSKLGRGPVFLHLLWFFSGLLIRWRRHHLFTRWLPILPLLRRASYFQCPALPPQHLRIYDPTPCYKYSSLVAAAPSEEGLSTLADGSSGSVLIIYTTVSVPFSIGLCFKNVQFPAAQLGNLILRRASLQAAMVAALAAQLDRPALRDLERTRGQLDWFFSLLYWRIVSRVF